MASINLTSRTLKSVEHIPNAKDVPANAQFIKKTISGGKVLLFEPKNAERTEWEEYTGEVPANALAVDANDLSPTVHPSELGIQAGK